MQKNSKKTRTDKILSKSIKSANINKNINILDLLNESLNSYIESKISSNLSKKTIYNIKTILDRFYDFVAEEMDENEFLSTKDINKYFLSSYLNKLTSTGISKSTQKLHLIIITNFLNYVSDSDIELYGEIRKNISGLKIKTPQKEKVGFSQNEQQQLTNYVKKLDAKNTYLAQRNALIIKILMHTGVRISELINIKWTDVTEYDDEKHGLIYVILVKGKGDKERYVYLSYEYANSNIAFLEKTKDTYLITSTHGNQCNRSKLFIVVKNILEKAGIAKSGLHIFRHTFARNLVNKDINLSTIKDLLGHANITVTAQFYAKSDESAKRNALFNSQKQA